jgi:gas vesicle protein
MTFKTKIESQSRNMLLALLAGVGAGVVVGLAIAPKSGQKLRADIGNTVDDYLDSASQKAEELRKSSTNLAQRGLKEAGKATSKASEKDQRYVQRRGRHRHGVVAVLAPALINANSGLLSTGMAASLVG